MAFNDIFRLRIYQRLHGAQVVNVLHFVQEDPLPTVGAINLATNFVTDMTATLRARASNNTAFEFVEVQSIVPFSGGPEVVNFPGGTVGQQTFPCVSATLAEVITIYSSRAGRRGRGRIYLAGAPCQGGQDIGSGTWLSPQTTRTVNFANQLAAKYMGSVPPVPFTLGVWSKRIAGPVPPWPTDAFVRATALSVRTIVRNQRRRQVGVGR